MWMYICRRLWSGLVTVVGISLLIFSVIHLLPGDPITVMFGQNPNPELMEVARKYYELDKPVIVQYFSWVSKILRGNLGKSIINNQPVAELLLPRIGRTFGLTIVGILFSLIVAIPSGIVAGWKHNTWADLGVTSFSLVLISIPEFWLGVVFMIIFGVWLRVLPVSGYVSPLTSIGGWLRTVTLPGLTVAFIQAAQTTRMVRANMIEVLGSDYIKLMRAGGVGNLRLLLVHAFRNAFIPVLTLVGMQIGYLMGGIVIVEQVFMYPGLGNLLIKSLGERNYPVIQACIMVYAVAFVVINIVVDVFYCLINPKVKLQ